MAAGQCAVDLQRRGVYESPKWQTDPGKLLRLDRCPVMFPAALADGQGFRDTTDLEPCGWRGALPVPAKIVAFHAAGVHPAPSTAELVYEDPHQYHSGAVRADS